MITTYPSRLKRRAGQFCSIACKAAASTTPPTVRVWRRVDVGDIDACWPYLGNHDRHGYGLVQVGRHNAGDQVFAHRLVFESIYGRLLPSLVIRHHCDNPPCCNPRHLAAGSQVANMADMLRRGRNSRGEHHTSKLTEVEVREMRALWTTGAWTMKALSRKYGVHRMTAKSAVLRKTWKHVD